MDENTIVLRIAPSEGGWRWQWICPVRGPMPPRGRMTGDEDVPFPSKQGAVRSARYFGKLQSYFSWRFEYADRFLPWEKAEEKETKR